MLAIVAFAFAVTDRVAYDAPKVLRAGWVQGKRAPATAKLQIHLLLKPENVAALEATLLEVSDPQSPRYGKHLSNEAVHALVAPSSSAFRAVSAFLSEHGVVASNATMNGDILKIASIPVATAERMLGCEYYEFHHADGTTALRTPSYSLPRAMRPFVAAVSPTVMLPPTTKPIRTPSHPDALLNTPKSLRKLYGVGETQGKATANKQAVTGFIGQTYSKGDYGEFKKILFNATALGYTLVGAPGGNLKSVGDDGGASLLGGIEAMLDAEYITAMGSNIATEFWGFKKSDPKGPDPDSFLDWLGLVSNTSDAAVPKVISTSYGEDESGTPLDYADRINVEFMKAGARGISLLFASGDSGAVAQSPQGSKCTFEAKWPAASPYVTAVGGTGGIGGESAVGLSSGGFSDRWKRPKWQQAAVDAYLAEVNLTKNKPYINSTTGRAFPDIAAQAVDFMTVGTA